MFFGLTLVKIKSSLKNEKSPVLLVQFHASDECTSIYAESFSHPHAIEFQDDTCLAHAMMISFCIAGSFQCGFVVLCHLRVTV
jgi:hypothetical protein